MTKKKKKTATIKPPILGKLHSETPIRYRYRCGTSFQMKYKTQKQQIKNDTQYFVRKE
jgi:hypothetical protein